MKAPGKGPRAAAAGRIVAMAALWLLAAIAVAPSATAVTDAPAAQAAADTDLAITSIGELRDPVLLGDTIRYRVNVKNNGPAADEATLLMTVPSGTTFGRTDPSKGTCSPPDAGGAFQCSLGTLTVGATASVDVYLETQSAGQVTFSARVEGTGTDTVPANNARSQTTTVSARPTDLGVTLTDAPDPASAGDTITYTAVVRNNGPVGADDVELDVSIPSGTAYQSVQTTVGSCSEPSPGISCALGRMEVGATATVTLRVRADGTGLFSSTATVSSTTPDSTAGNDSATATTKVAGPETDVVIAVTDAPDPVLEGDTLTYTMTITNAGPAAADSVTVTSAVPAQATFEDLRSTTGTCSTAGTSPVKVTCALGTLGSGASATVTLKVTALKVGDLSLTASVDSAAKEKDASDNAATATTRVAPKAADLRPVITATPDPVLLGDVVQLDIAVVNPDVAPAEAVQLQTAIPEGTTLVSQKVGRFTCGATGAELVCQVARINGGTSAAVQLRVRTSRLGAVTTSATVSSTTKDPDRTNNATTVTATVVDELPQDPPGDGAEAPVDSNPAPPPGGGGDGPGGSQVEVPSVSVSLLRSAKRTAKRIAFRVTANEADSKVTVSLRDRRGRTLARKTVTLAEAGTRTVSIKMTRALKRKLKFLKRGSLLTAHVLLDPPTGDDAEDTATLRLSRKRTIVRT